MQFMLLVSFFDHSESRIRKTEGTRNSRFSMQAGTPGLPAQSIGSMPVLPSKTSQNTGSYLALVEMKAAQTSRITFGDLLRMLSDFRLLNRYQIQKPCWSPQFLGPREGQYGHVPKAKDSNEKKDTTAGQHFPAASSSENYGQEFSGANVTNAWDVVLMNGRMRSLRGCGYQAPLAVGQGKGGVSVHA